MFEIIPKKIDSPLLTSGLSIKASLKDNPAKFTARKIKVKYKIETNSPKNNIFDKFLINNFLSNGRRGGRRGGVFCHILPYQNVSFCYDKLVKLIGISREKS